MNQETYRTNTIASFKSQADDTASIVASTGEGLEVAVGSDLTHLIQNSQSMIGSQYPRDVKGLLARLFPDPMERARRKGLGQLTENELAFQIRMHGAYRESEARILDAMLKNFLIQGKTGLQTRTARYVMERQREFLRQAEILLEDHQENVRVAYDRSSQLPTNELKEIEVNRIIKSYARLVADLEMMAAQYSEIVAESIPSARK